MFYSSSKHPFDTLFVIVCVIAGATSHGISNTSKSTQTNHQLQNRYRTSVIDFILDAGLIELLQSSNTINKGMVERIKFSSDQESLVVSSQPQTICVLLSNILHGNQIKFCRRHQDLLESVLTQVVQLTRRECLRITSDLRWNCTAIEPFLDRSNSLCRYHLDRSHSHYRSSTNQALNSHSIHEGGRAC